MNNEALNYFLGMYKEFLKGKDTYCQITLSREQATEFIKEVEEIENKLDRWIELLQIDGRNTKHQVLMEMKEIRGKRK